MSPTLTVMKHFALILLAALTWSVNAQITCVDPLACNFTELGECEFLDDNGMPCVTEGCAIPGACNYNPEADINDGSCEFTSCLGCTDEAACNYDPEAVYLDLSCIYFVDCNGVCGGDWIEDECGNCYPQTVDSGEIEFSFTGNPQLFVVPAFITSLTVTLRGASGWGGTYNGGRGGLVSGTLSVLPGDSLWVYVGEEGRSCTQAYTPMGGGWNGGGDGQANSSTNTCGGGGGATDIRSTYSIDPTELASLESRLVVAGGGGGATNNGGCYGGDGGGDVGGSNACGHPIGTGGGQDSGGTYGGAFGQGGNAEGWMKPWNGGGGGGWYGGGVSTEHAGGGGGSSYVAELTELSTNQQGAAFGNGIAVISWSGLSAPDCELGCVVAEACNFNPEATNDDGSCDFCFCGPGTEYDIELGQCMIVNGSPDINGDGCTNLNDLLDLLSGYGTCDD